MHISDDFLESLNFKSEYARRKFLKTSGIVALAAQFWMPTAADARQYLRAGRNVTFRNAHTNEVFKGVFFENGRYNKDAFDEIKTVFRDHRTNERFPIDPRLIDILHVLQKRSGNKQGFDLYSGYRSPKTNAKLRRVSNGVAKKSFHMLGQAVDLRLPGTNLFKLRRDAVSLKAGGVGYYPESKFLHLDTGTPRSWS